MNSSKFLFKTCGASYVPFFLRLILGVVFFAHGSQKLLGLWGGAGLQKTAEGFAAMGFQPGIFWASLVACTEFFGAILLFTGLLTRVAALGIAVTMAVAVMKVHLAQGFFAMNGGFEYSLTLFVLAVILVGTGGGAFSGDSCICKKNCEDAGVPPATV